jgi:hypothetical protein
MNVTFKPGSGKNEYCSGLLRIPNWLARERPRHQDSIQMQNQNPMGGV